MSDLVKFYNLNRCREVYLLWQTLSKRLDHKPKLPLVFGGAAKYCFGMRDSIRDLDLLIPPASFEKIYKASSKEEQLYQLGERGISLDRLELWESIFKKDYIFWKTDAYLYEEVFIISPHMQLLMSDLAVQVLSEGKRMKQLKDHSVLINLIVNNTYTREERNILIH